MAICSICQDEINIPIKLMCNCINIEYCSECIFKWFKYKGNTRCPICKEKGLIEETILFENEKYKIMTHTSGYQVIFNNIIPIYMDSLVKIPNHNINGYYTLMLGNNKNTLNDIIMSIIWDLTKDKLCIIPNKEKYKITQYNNFIYCNSYGKSIANTNIFEIDKIYYNIVNYNIYTVLRSS